MTCVVLEGGRCSACNELATIRQKIKQLEAEIEELKTRHQYIRVTAVNAIHDPFNHKFPPEISSHIFRLSLPSPLDSGDISLESLNFRLAAPLRLGRVCRMWRQLAWRTPALWQNVYLAIRPSTRHSLAKSLPGLLREWLDRSRVLPLTISFLHFGWPHRRDIWGEILSEDDISDSDGPVVKVNNVNTLKVATRLAIKVLNSYSGRWQNLHITAVADIFEHFYRDVQPNQPVNLCLRVFNPSQQQPPPNFMMESKFTPTQLLLIAFPLTSVNICWDGITHLTLRDISIYSQEGIDVLQRAPRLEYYDISILQQSEVVFGKHILHPRLRSLKLANYIEDFLEAVTLPSLEEWTQRLNGVRVPVAILSLLEKSGCHLKVLNLMHVPDDPEGLNTLLQAIPSLEHIELSFESGFNASPMMDDILTRIFNPPSDNEDPAPDSLLPCLQSMHCMSTSIEEDEPFSWDRIPQLYRQSRRQSLALKSTAYQSGITRETGFQLLQLTDEGVDLQVIDGAFGGDLLALFRIWRHENAA